MLVDGDDVFWSAGCVYLTGLTLNALLRLGRIETPPVTESGEPPTVIEIDFNQLDHRQLPKFRRRLR